MHHIQLRKVFLNRTGIPLLPFLDMLHVTIPSAIIFEDAGRSQIGINGPVVIGVCFDETVCEY
jgi:hypothetical protein